MVWAVALSAMKLIPHSLIAVILGSDGIRSLIGFGSLVGSLSHSVLYLHRSTYHNTRPQAISERTSYHGV